MAKIILSMDGTVLREMTLLKERMTIGRGQRNDIVIDDLAVSGRHAAIVTTGEGSYLEDLNSTNGTQVNGQPVATHFLQDRDVIELAKYRLTYLRGGMDDGHPGKGAALSASGSRNAPRLRILNGTGMGRETLLSKPVTTVGHPDADIAAIIRQAHGYTLTHIGGESRPRVNGAAVDAGAHHLQHGDVIDVAMTRLQFLAD